jgi:pyrroline-5-carboxylate reductase
MAAPTSDERLGRVAVIGLGRIGTAIAAAVAGSDRLDPGALVGAEPDADRAAEVAGRLHIATTTDNREAVRGADIVLLAVKPHLVADVAADIAPVLDDATLVVSVAAGIRTATIEEALGRPLPVVRIMPNTPLLVGQGMSVLAPGTHAHADHLDRAGALVAGAGDVLVIDESLFDAVTAVSGSGPAYVFALAEAMIGGAIDQGLDPDDAVALVEQTIAGAGALLRSSDLDAAALREMVSSPGGTTVAGLARLAAHGLDDAVADAIAAATARGRELGG